MSKFLPNPGFDPQHIDGVHAHLLEAASALGAQATSNAREVSATYEARVEETGSLIQVVGENQALDAAGWIEFGTQNLPAVAPIRRAVESLGFRLEGP